MRDSESRREFLGRAISLAAVLPALGALSSCALSGLPVYKSEASDGRLALNLTEIPELNLDGGAVQIDTQALSHSLVIVRLNVDTFAAVVPICSHLGCSVRKEGTGFFCPCHGSEYDLDGSVVQGPAERPLKNYRAELSGDLLTVYLTR